MAATQHTQGPWQIHGRARSGGLTKSRFIIAGTTNGQPDVSGALVGELEVSEADARLIVAAPELLEIAMRWNALDGGAWDVQRHAADRRELMTATRAAIAKAGGR